MHSQYRAARRLAIGLVLTLVLVLILGWRVIMAPARNQEDSSVKSAVTTSEIEEFIVPPISNPGYIGPMACATCHAERVAEFQTTRHFVANVTPNPKVMPNGFAGVNGVHVVPELALRFEMTESTRGFLQTAIRDTESGKQTTSSEIAFCYGSAGGNDEVYFTWHKDQLYELPMVWLAPQNEWGTAPFDPHGSGDFSRETTIRCIECHNTWFERIPGGRNQYSRDHAILGVTCEICHGPGLEHANFHKENPKFAEPHAIVRPGTLSRERKMDLCAQCHSNALKHRGPDFGYRPGLLLDDYYVTLKTTHPEDDHVANQTTYLRESRCFQKSDTLSCVTCHDPHQPRSTTNAGAASCRNCHQNTDCKERLRLPAELQSECVKCHMPESRKIQVYFRTADDKYVAPVKRFEHRIGIYPAAKNEVLWEWYQLQSDSTSRDESERLAKWLGNYWRSEADQRQRDYRFLAAIDACRESIRFDADPVMREKLRELISIQWGIDTDLHEALWLESQRRFEPAIDAYKRVLAAKPNHALAHGKLGTAYAVMQQRPLALEHLQASMQYDSNDPYAPAMLGWLAYLDGRPKEALDYYRQADAVEPYRAKIHHQMGLALAKMDRFQDASAEFEKAVEIDPRDVNAHRGLSQVLVRLNQPENAIRHELLAARITGFRDPEILLGLAELYAGVDRMQDAIETAKKALGKADSRQPQFVAQIRRRLGEFESRHQKISKQLTP